MTINTAAAKESKRKITTPLVTYRRHWCTRRHRTYDTFARCVWKWHTVEGEGQYALVNNCRPKDVVLYDDEKVARKALKRLNRNPCCGQCVQEHLLVRLELL